MITKVTAGDELESLHSSEEDDNMAVVSDFSVIKSTWTVMKGVCEQLTGAPVCLLFTAWL